MFLESKALGLTPARSPKGPRARETLNLQFHFKSFHEIAAKWTDCFLCHRNGLFWPP